MFASGSSDQFDHTWFYRSEIKLLLAYLLPSCERHPSFPYLKKCGLANRWFIHVFLVVLFLQTRFLFGFDGIASPTLGPSFPESAFFGMTFCTGQSMLAQATWKANVADRNVVIIDLLTRIFSLPNRRDLVI